LSAQKSPLCHSPTPPGTVPYDISTLETFCLQPLGPMSGPSAETDEAAKPGNDREGSGSKSQPSGQEIIQFVQFMPPNDQELAGDSSSTVITRDEFDGLVESYITSLARKNREKALMSLAKYSDILRVLEDEEAGENSAHASASSAQDTVEETPTSLSPVAHGDDSTEDFLPSSLAIPDGIGVPNIDGPTPNTPQRNSQFRAWARKKFALQQGDVNVVTHHGKLVAVQEHLYDILVYCHRQTNHGGRDKTNTLVNKYYSYVPKVFIESFVKACPGCPRKLGSGRRIAARSQLGGFDGDADPAMVQYR